jgi:hypothetical protein
MSAYKDAFAIDDSASDEQLALAKEILASGRGYVLFERQIALRAIGAYLLCEVIDQEPSAHRCSNEYEVLVENAQRALEASRLQKFLPALPLKWLVVEDSDAGIEELWHAP